MKHPLLSEVGRRVRAHRERLAWSQRWLAERAGLSVRFLAQLERGDGNISLARFAKVAGALGVDAGELLSSTAPPACPLARSSSCTARRITAASSARPSADSFMTCPAR